MTVTEHARSQLAERLPAHEVAEIIRRLERWRGEMVRTARIMAHLGEARGDRSASNGELVVAVCSERVVVTIMYRRASQPFTCEALRVGKLIGHDGKVLRVLPN